MKTSYKIIFSIATALLIAGIGLFGNRLMHRSAPEGTTTVEGTPVNADITDPTTAGGTANPAGGDQQVKPPPTPRPPFAVHADSDTRTQLPANLQSLEPKSYTGILVDAEDGRVLWHHDSDTLVPIASMTKMMSTLVAMEEIERRSDLTLDTGVKVTQDAMDIGGSQVYLGKDEVFTLRELMQAMMIHSANDCAYAVAQAVAPNFDTSQFMALMNRRARDLGLVQTRFFNMHGLPEKDPDRDCRSTAAELAVIAHECLQKPEIMEWAGTWHLAFRPNSEKPLIMENRNKLVNTCPGVTGLKTGFIDRAGSCITVTCTRNNRTFITVVTGFPAWRERNDFVAALLDWGYTRP